MWASCFDAYTLIFAALAFESHVSFTALLSYFFVESINIVTGCEGGEWKEERRKMAESSRMAARRCSFSIADQTLRCVTCKRKQKKNKKHAVFVALQMAYWDGRGKSRDLLLPYRVIERNIKRCCAPRVVSTVARGRCLL
uniref:Uncharacterized protein n=1 Tax=Ixodes ricinus TaxID=34613 RepID=A0A6B0UT04_IXORI